MWLGLNWFCRLQFSTSFHGPSICWRTDQNVHTATLDSSLAFCIKFAEREETRSAFNKDQVNNKVWNQVKSQKCFACLENEERLPYVLLLIKKKSKYICVENIFSFQMLEIRFPLFRVHKIAINWKYKIDFHFTWASKWISTLKIYMSEMRVFYIRLHSGVRLILNVFLSAVWCGSELKRNYMQISNYQVTSYKEH